MIVILEQLHNEKLIAFDSEISDKAQNCALSPILVF